AGDAFAVRAERHAVDVTGVPFEREDLLVGLGVPHLKRPVPAAARDPFAVGAEGHAGDPGIQDTSFGADRSTLGESPPHANRAASNYKSKAELDRWFDACLSALSLDASWAAVQNSKRKRTKSR